MNEDYVEQLAELITKLKSPELAKAFLQNILTPSDLDEISVRLQVFKLLHKGLPQREVAKSLGVSIGTVSRGAREMKYGEAGIKVILDKNENLRA